MFELHHSAPVSPSLPRLSASARSTIRVLAAAVLSFGLPGLGQIYLGYRKRGLLMLAVTVALVVLVVVSGPRNPFDMLSLAVQPRFLLGLMAANILLLGFRLFSIYDAYRLARKNEPPSRAWQRPLLATMLAITMIAAIPHIAVGYYDYVTFDTVHRLFNHSGSHARTPPPTEIEVSRPINLAPGVNPAAPAVTAEGDVP